LQLNKAFAFEPLLSLPPSAERIFSEGVRCEFVPDCFAREGEYMFSL